MSAKLLVQPDAGIGPVVQAIDRAGKTVDIVIFRLDRAEVEEALVRAVKRGVEVCALIAARNKMDGEKGLAELERRLKAGGVRTVRTADDLVRYHYKFLVVDRRELYLLGFNYTRVDLRSRSFGLSTTDKSLVAEALKLFEADSRREPYTASHEGFIVSPVNARAALAALIRSATRSIVLYDPKVADPAMIHCLEERAQAGVEVRIIGRVTRKYSGFEARGLNGLRLHTRTMVVDGDAAFVGSQSLRALELDSRREAGIILHDVKIAGEITGIFENDWKIAGAERPKEADDQFPAAKVAKKTAKAVARSLPPLAPVVEQVVKKVAGDDVPVNLDIEVLEDTVKQAVREAVRDAVEQVVETQVQ